jgi:hypothetical protein
LNSRELVCLALLIVVPTVASAGEPGREFTATAVVDTPQGTRRMPVTLVIDRYTGLEQAQALKPVLEQGGQGALVAALQARRDGRLVLGALELPIALAIAVPTDDGFWHVLFTPRQIRVGETERGSESLDYPFGVAAFELGDFGTGNGDLHVAAALAIDDEGYVTVADYENMPGQLLEIKKVR